MAKSREDPWKDLPILTETVDGELIELPVLIEEAIEAAPETPAPAGDAEKVAQLVAQLEPKLEALLRARMEAQFEQQWTATWQEIKQELPELVRSQMAAPRKRSSKKNSPTE